MIRVTPTLLVDERDVRCTHIRAHGPGGQHVNKVATAVQLRYNPRGYLPVPDDVYGRLRAVAGRRMASDGTIRITARRFRSQERNLDDARERLVALLRRATRQERPRRKTRPTAASRRQRLADKRRRAHTKCLRRAAVDDD